MYTRGCCSAGLIIYFRKEGRALGEVTKYLVYNRRKRQEGGDTAAEYFNCTQHVAGVMDMRFQVRLLSLPRVLLTKCAHGSRPRMRCVALAAVLCSCSGIFFSEMVVTEQALMPDSLHWMGVTRIHTLVSRSDMKYEAITKSVRSRRLSRPDLSSRIPHVEPLIDATLLSSDVAVSCDGGCVVFSLPVLSRASRCSSVCRSRPR